MKRRIGGEGGTQTRLSNSALYGKGRDEHKTAAAAGAMVLLVCK